MSEQPTTHICPVCRGRIIERSDVSYIPVWQPDLFGPGSYNIATEEDRHVCGWHCETCGIEFHHLPTFMG